MNQSTQLVVVAVVALLVGLGIGRVSFKQPVMAPVVVPNSNQTMTDMDHSMHQTTNSNATSSMANTSSTMDMAGMMHSMMAGLQGKTGDAFDETFLEEMIIHHQGAIEMAKAVLTSSSRPELKALANDIVTAQTKEIQQMQAWRSEWFGK